MNFNINGGVVFKNKIQADFSTTLAKTKPHKIFRD